MSIIAVPILALSCNIIVVTVGSWRFARAGHVDWRRIGPLVMLSVPLAWLGGRPEVPELWFDGMLALSVLVSGLLMLWQTRWQREGETARRTASGSGPSQAARSFTRSTVEALAADGLTRFDLLDLIIIHRVGELFPGEAIVCVAFDAVDYLIDRLKTEAPFWKREHGPAGSRWVERTPADRANRKRWDRN